MTGTPTQTSAKKPVGVPARYFLRFPETWWDLDLDPSTRDAAIRRRLLAGFDEQPADRETAELVDGLVRSARKAAREAQARGALQLAGIFELFEGMPVMASTSVFRVSPPPDSAPDLSELMVAYAVRNAGLPPVRGSGADQPGNGAELIELPIVGPAGRVTSVEDVDFYGRGWVRMAVMQTVVPIPGGAGFLVIASSTPNLPLAREFFTVFDAIAETLHFGGAG